MASYTTWQKVVDLYPLAADIESNGTNQTNLITAKSQEFQSYLRILEKADLTSPYDEVTKKTVAFLVLDELLMRRLTDDSDFKDVEYDHYSGRVTWAGAIAHAQIDAIRRGSVVLDQHAAEGDINRPKVVPASGNSSTGKIEAYLPHGYKNDATDTILIKCTTAGRVDDKTAQFAWYVNNNATASGSGLTCSGTWTELQYELYIRFLDGAQSSNQFILNDTWTIKAYPQQAAARGTGPSTFEVLRG